MTALLIGLLFLFLLTGFPLYIGMIIAPLVVAIVYFPQLGLEMIMQQLAVGVQSSTLLAIPMYVLAAEVMVNGQAAKRLLKLIDSFLGHIHGGLAITAEATCTVFGAISGSAVATMVAIGKPLRPGLLDSGYKDSHIVAMMMAASNIAFLIPPSLVMIMYCVVTGTSVANLFIAGVIPGLLLFLAFAVYDYIYARKNHLPTKPRGSWKERIISLKGALLSLGLPVIILGSIYTGFASPTEAAALSVLYAMFIEMVIYRSFKLKDMIRIAYNTAVVTAAIMVLIAAGQVFSWVITFANIPNMLTSAVLSLHPSGTVVLLITSLIFFVALMFVDCIPVIMIVIPILFPIATAAGVDPIHLGIIVVAQSGLGSITPPFGANIFTACVLFEKKFTEVLEGILPYLLIFLAFCLFLVFVPQVSTALIH